MISSGNSFTKKARDDSNRGQDSHARYESFRSLRREVRAIHPCRLRNHGQIGARLKSVTVVEPRECRFLANTSRASSPLSRNRQKTVLRYERWIRRERSKLVRMIDIW